MAEPRRAPPPDGTRGVARDGTPVIMRGGVAVPLAPPPSRNGPGPQVIVGQAPPSVRGDIARGAISEAQAQYAAPTAAADASKAQADAAKAQIDLERAQRGVPLPDHAEAVLVDGASTLQTLSSLMSTYRPEYGGNLAGDIENRLQSLNAGIGTPGQREWWANMRRMDAVQRNVLFGASLTAGEKAAWDATTVAPNMSPEVIKQNLTKRALVAQGALARRQASNIAAGYSQPQIAAVVADVAPLLTPEALERNSAAYYKEFPAAQPQADSPWNTRLPRRPDLPAAGAVAPGEVGGGQMGDVGRLAADSDFRMLPEQEQALMALANDPNTPPEVVAAKAADFARAAGHAPDAAWLAAIAASVSEGRGKGGMRGVAYSGSGPVVEVRPTTGADGVTEIPSSAGPGATSLTPGETATNAVVNLLPSAANFAKDTASAIVHPVETVKTIGALAAGALSKTGMVDADETTVDALGSFYADRYGSVDGFKRAIADDPVGVLADAATVLSAGGGAAAKVGNVARVAPLAKIGEAAGNVGRAIDPVNIAGGAARMAATVPAVSRGLGAARSLPGLAAAYGLALPTGASPEAFTRGANIGREVGRAGGQTPRSANFLDHLRGGAPVDEVVAQTEQVLANMQRDASAAYNSGMAAVSGDATILDFAGIDAAVAALRDRAYHGDRVKNPQAARVFTEARAIIDDWKTGDPAVYHTPTGMDALKQRLGGVADSAAAQGDRTAATIANGLYREVREAVANQVPTYAANMRGYEDAQRALGELRSTFSLGRASSTDTKLRKLQSIMRNNANTNYGRREALGRTLDAAQGGEGLLDSLAAQSANSILPRGLQRVPASMALGSGAGGLAALPFAGAPAYLNPGVLAALPLTSPRLMAEASYFAGKGAGTAERFAGPVLRGLARKYSAVDPTGLYAAQTINAADSAQDEKGMMAQLAAKYAQALQMPSFEQAPQDPLPLGAVDLGTGNLDPNTGLPMREGY